MKGKGKQRRDCQPAKGKYLRRRKTARRRGVRESGEPWRLVSQEISELKARIEEWLAALQEPGLYLRGRRIGSLNDLELSFESGRHLVVRYRTGGRQVRRRIIDASRSESGAVILQAAFLRREEPIEIRAAEAARPRQRLRAGRLHFQRMIEWIIARNFPRTRILASAVSTDLEHSISGKYVRITFLSGRSRWHAAAVSPWEDQATVDGLLSTALLWRDFLQRGNAARAEKLLLIAPAGKSLVLRSRMGWIAGAGRQIHLMEMDGDRESLVFVDPGDSGNLDTSLTQVQVPSDCAQALSDERAQRLVRLAADEINPVIRANHVAFRIHGLEFAQLQLGHKGKLIFGLSESSTVRNESDWNLLAQCVSHILKQRRASSRAGNALYSLQAERWLESLILRDVRIIDSGLNPNFVYPQVPAFLSGDRGMIDILTVTRHGQLAILELKVSEDIELPMQGLDYWLRVRWHHLRREFQNRGYFPGVEISEAVPLLFFVCPQFRYHSSFPAIAGQISSAVPMVQVGINENWREGVQVVLKRGINYATSR